MCKKKKKVKKLSTLNFICNKLDLQMVEYSVKYHSEHCINVRQF